MKEQLNKIEQQIDVERKEREELINHKHQDLNVMQTKIAQQIAEEVKVRKDVELRLLKQIDEKSSQVNAEIAKEADSRNEVVFTLQNYLEVEIPTLYDSLKAGVNEREQTEEMMLRQIGEEF